MIIENVDWQITSRCNRNCSYCYGPKKENELSIVQAKRIVDLLKSQGVKQIGITGGEPLLYPYIEELINYIYDCEIKIYLSTNCDFYERYSRLIKSKISILGVPVDGATDVLHDTCRGKGSFDSVTHSLQDICNSSCLPQIKIGTVITKYNYSDLINIERIISRFESKLLYWKLYELIVYSRNIDQAKPLKFSIQNPKKVLGNYIDKNKIIFDTIDIRNKSYFFIKPNGDIFIPFLSSECSYEKDIGNILKDDFDSISAKFKDCVNWDGYNKEFRYIKKDIEEEK